MATISKDTYAEMIQNIRASLEGNLQDLYKLQEVTQESENDHAQVAGVVICDELENVIKWAECLEQFSQNNSI